MPLRLPPCSRLALTFALVLLPAVPRLHAAGGVQVSVKDDKGQPVADAVVSLLRLDSPTPPKPPAEPVLIAQQGQEFEPHVTAVVVGTRVNFSNTDRVHHQIYSLSKPKRFEIALHPPGSENSVLLDQPGIVALGCNIHDWMSSYIVVLATPHFTKTPVAGVASLTDLPPGRYRLDVWHPRLSGNSTREIVIAPADATSQTITIVLKEAKSIRRAPESMGGGYRE
jgi:plastocyanin